MRIITILFLLFNYFHLLAADTGNIYVNNDYSYLKVRLDNRFVGYRDQLLFQHKLSQLLPFSSFDQNLNTWSLSIRSKNIHDYSTTAANIALLNSFKEEFHIISIEEVRTRSTTTKIQSLNDLSKPDKDPSITSDYSTILIQLNFGFDDRELVNTRDELLRFGYHARVNLNSGFIEITNYNHMGYKLGPDNIRKIFSQNFVLDEKISSITEARQTRTYRNVLNSSARLCSRIFKTTHRNKKQDLAP